jgi:hypothetical protein
MKKQFAIMSFVLMITVLSSILFQSWHSYEHLAKQFAQKWCNHEHHSKSEITHQHHNFDHCSLCEFTFSSSIKPQSVCLNFKKIDPIMLRLIDFSHKIHPSFPGSLFALRAPPTV